jgi:hypothetical protein
MATPGGGLKVFVTDRDNFATATMASNAFSAAFSRNAAAFAPLADGRRVVENAGGGGK